MDGEPMTWWLAVVFVVLACVFALYLSVTAGRLDRLHRRIDSAQANLSTLLLRRNSAAIELASSGLLDPASSVLILNAAHVARECADDTLADRSFSESALSAALNAALDESHEPDEPGLTGLEHQLITEVVALGTRVQLSRRFLNDAVRACRQVRQQQLVRIFRLAGHTAWPQTMEMDDALPVGLGPR